MGLFFRIDNDDGSLRRGGVDFGGVRDGYDILQRQERTGPRVFVFGGGDDAFCSVDAGHYCELEVTGGNKRRSLFECFYGRFRKAFPGAD